MTSPDTNLVPQKFVFLWDTWENRFLIPFKCGELPDTWFTLADISNGSQAISMPPLETLATYLQIFNSIDTSNPTMTPPIGGAAESAGQEWRRVNPVRGDKLTEIVEEPSDEEQEAHEDVRCGICHCKEASIQFRQCTHALCADCNDSYWWSLISIDIMQGRDPVTTLRLSFPCHMCRAEIYHERHITQEDSDNQINDWYLTALKPEFVFHRVFVIRVEADDRVTAEPLLGDRDRLHVCVDGDMVKKCWDVYLIYAMMMLIGMVDTLRNYETVVY